RRGRGPSERSAVPRRLDRGDAPTQSLRGAEGRRRTRHAAERTEGVQVSVEFPGEVVTRALVRFVAVPGLARRAALITLDNGFDHTKPNSFGPGGLASLDAALDEAFAADPAFIALTGKPFVFSVGADITGFPRLTEREQGLAIGRLGHRVFRRLRDSAVPTFAFVNGAALGGGLELALHCHYRTLSRAATAIGLPEIFLGLLPGWGGTQLLPKLVGADAAVTVMIENPLNT